MDHKLFKDYFSRGFEDGLEKIARRNSNEKKGLDPFATKDWGDTIGSSIVDTVSKAAVKGAMHLGISGAKGAYRAAIGDKLRGRHKEFISRLMATDSILKGRSKDVVLAHYKTMLKVAPSISLDPNIVSSFLRESTAYETISTVTIKTLLDLEKTIAETEEKQGKKYSYLIGGGGK